MLKKRSHLENSKYNDGEDAEEILDDPQPVDEERRVKPSQASRKTVRISNDDRLKKLSLKCEWGSCSEIIKKLVDYINHVAGHLAVTVYPLEHGNSCYWRDCDLSFNTRDELELHALYHAFHKKVKVIGTSVMSEMNLQCTLDSQGQNLIPEIQAPFQCMWGDCDVRYYSVQHFFWHVQGHVLVTDKDGTSKSYSCHWQGCNSKKQHLSRLKDHMMTHTQEKVIGCPNCGGIFASNTKFIDHLQKQLSPQSQVFQCSHCAQSFPSERLLRDHVRFHVNHYKCPQCDMTCPTRAILAKHVKFRHSTDRGFKCSQCPKSFKMLNDLTRHLLTHSEHNPYACDINGCDFTCRAITTLNSHIKKTHHGGKEYPYLCHICNKCFTSGAPLTKHLIAFHDFRWPSGHSRFRYQQDENGYFRLQTVRYESLELTQEIMRQQNACIESTSDVNLEALVD